MTTKVKPTQKLHTFLDYEVNPNLREIHQIKTQLKVSKKSFDILLLLIEKQGQVVTKQEIIEHVWPKQIVTDAALNKQITRLRNDLVSHKSTDQVIIETVRGIGIRLIPTVKSKQINPKKISTTLVWGIPLLIISVLIIYSGSFFNSLQINTSTDKTGNSNHSYNIVFVPAKKSVDWLNVGGLAYLSAQLHKHKQVQSISPRTQWFKHDDSQSLAIEISQRDGIDYVLAVHNLQKGKNYSSDLLLRNKSGILAKQTINAISITLLFDQIDSWVTRQLNISDKLSTGEVNNYHPTDFALESYLRARESALHKSYGKAAQLFQTAINEDPKFYAASLGLADVESELGNYQKSLALIETLINNKDFDSSLLNQLYTIKAKNLMFLNNIDEAHIALDKSMQLSKQTLDYSALVKAMTVKVVIDANTNNITQETIDTLLEQLKILRKHQPEPNLIALSSSNLAGMYQNIGQLQSAIKHATVAVEVYTILNNNHGIVFSNTVLARIYNSMGDVGKALLTLEKINDRYKQLDGIQVSRMFLQYKAENQTYFGLRKEALMTIDELLELSLKHTDLTSKVIAFALLADLNIIYKDYEAAKANVQQLLEINRSKPSGYVSAYKDIIFAYDLFVFALTEPPDSASIKLKTYLKDNPTFATNYSKELKNIEAIILNKQGFKVDAVKKYHELVTEYTSTNQNLNALYSGYKILDLQWQNDMKDYVKTMNYLDEIAIFKYPIHKYKAQYLAYNKDYIDAYVMMEDLKSKANQFWTTQDQLQLEEYKLHSLTE